MASLQISKCAQYFTHYVEFEHKEVDVTEELRQFRSNYPVSYYLLPGTPTPDGGPATHQTGLVSVKSAEVCSRIIGRKGVNVRHIRVATSTTINSPKILKNKSTHIFHVQSNDEDQLCRAILILMYLADFFYQKIAERELLTNEYDIREYMLVPNDLVQHMIKRRGQFLVDLRETLNVNIITPKSYAEKPQFIIIGQPDKVAVAKFCIGRRIRILMHQIGKDKFDPIFHELYL